MSVSGNQIKAARALAGMDQKALADAAGVGINTIRNFEGQAKQSFAAGSTRWKPFAARCLRPGSNCLMTARPPQAVRACACAGNSLTHP